MRIVPLLLLAGAVASCERTERSKNPTELGQLLGDPDPERAGRAMQAMLAMSKIDLEVLRAAADGLDA